MSDPHSAAPVVVSVTKFGAKGDGVTDDTESFKAAYAHASTLDLAQKLQASCALQAEVLKAMLRELEEQQARADQRYKDLHTAADDLQSTIAETLSK